VLTGKPLNSSDIAKWNNKGVTAWQEIDTKTWVYKDTSGNVVRYPNSYPDFTPYERQSVDIPDMQGNHGKTGNGDFAKADAAAPKTQAIYDSDNWHHHKNGKLCKTHLNKHIDLLQTEMAYQILIKNAKLEDISCQ